MDIPARLSNADEQSHELVQIYMQMETRIAAFTELQASLTDLHEQLAQLRKELSTLQQQLLVVQNTMPTIARTEEFERVVRKINALPFERLATTKDL